MQRGRKARAGARSKHHMFIPRCCEASVNGGFLHVWWPGSAFMGSCLESHH